MQVVVAFCDFAISHFAILRFAFAKPSRVLSDFVSSQATAKPSHVFGVRVLSFACL